MKNQLHPEVQAYLSGHLAKLETEYNLLNGRLKVCEQEIKIVTDHVNNPARLLQGLQNGIPWHQNFDKVERPFWSGNHGNLTDQQQNTLSDALGNFKGLHYRLLDKFGALYWNIDIEETPQPVENKSATLINAELNKNNARIDEIKKEQNALLDQHAELDKEHTTLRSRNAELQSFPVEGMSFYSDDQQEQHLTHWIALLDMSLPVGIALAPATAESIDALVKDINEQVDDIKATDELHTLTATDWLKKYLPGSLTADQLTQLEMINGKLVQMKVTKGGGKTNSSVPNKAPKSIRGLIDSLVNYYKTNPAHKDESIQYFTPDKKDIESGQWLMTSKIEFGRVQFGPNTRIVNNILRGLDNNEYSAEAIDILRCPRCGVASFLSAQAAHHVSSCIALHDNYRISASKEPLNWNEITRMVNNLPVKMRILKGRECLINTTMFDFLEGKSHLLSTDAEHRGTLAVRADLDQYITSLRRITKSLAVCLDGADTRLHPTIIELLTLLIGKKPEVYTYATSMTPPNGLIIINVGEKAHDSTFSETLNNAIIQATGGQVVIEALYA